MSTPSSPAPASTTVYFITGASRGIGFGLAERYASRPDTLVFAGARDPSKADKLQQLAKQHKNVRIVQLAVTSDADHQAAAKQVEAEAGRVDVLLANAGISSADASERVKNVALDGLREHLEVNTVGPIRLFDAFFSLLSRSSQPKFVVVSSTLGSVETSAKYPDFSVASYGASKAAVNFLTQRVHIEHPNIIAFPLCPGWVQTDMGNAGAATIGLKEAPLTLKDSVDGITKLVDEATRETHSGKYWSAPDGSNLPW